MEIEKVNVDFDDYFKDPEWPYSAEVDLGYGVRVRGLGRTMLGAIFSAIGRAMAIDNLSKTLDVCPICSSECEDRTWGGTSDTEFEKTIHCRECDRKITIMVEYT